MWVCTNGNEVRWRRDFLLNHSGYTSYKPHYFARVFGEMGHTVKMMSPQFVKPYIKSNKNDRNDACGIAEAVTRPDMRFVPIKKIEQQDMLLSHRARELAVKQRTAQANQIRGLLA